MSEVDSPHRTIAWGSCLLVSMLACGGSSDLSEPLDELASIRLRSLEREQWEGK